MEYVKEQTPEICLEAVKESGLALQFVKEQTPEICLEAVKQERDVFPFVQPQFKEAVTQALNSSPQSQQDVKESLSKSNKTQTMSLF